MYLQLILYFRFRLLQRHEYWGWEIFHFAGNRINCLLVLVNMFMHSFDHIVVMTLSMSDVSSNCQHPHLFPAPCHYYILSRVAGEIYANIPLLDWIQLVNKLISSKASREWRDVTVCSRGRETIKLLFNCSTMFLLQCCYKIEFKSSSLEETIQILWLRSF